MNAERHGNAITIALLVSMNLLLVALSFIAGRLSSPSLQSCQDQPLPEPVQSPRFSIVAVDPITAGGETPIAVVADNTTGELRLIGKVRWPDGYTNWFSDRIADIGIIVEIAKQRESRNENSEKKNLD